MSLRAALALGLAFLASDARGQTRRALLVGIDDYGGSEAAVSAPPSSSIASKSGTSRRSRDRGNWGNLDGAVNDALAVRDLLTSRLGFAPEHVTVLTNGDATREAIVGTFRRVLVAEAAQGDVTFFYFAGHGSQVLNSLSPEPDRLDETLVPADSRAGAPDLRDKELAPLFVEAAARTRLTVVLDSCHSGGAMRGAGKVRATPPDRSRDARDPEPGPRPEDHGVLVLAAALDAQPAGEARDAAGTPHGAFTAALLGVFERLPGDATAEELFSSAKAAMQRGTGGQEPVLYAPKERRREPLLGFGGRGESALRVAVARAPPDGDRFLVEAGLAHQVGPGTVLRAIADRSVRLVVREVAGPSASVAALLEGDAAPLRAGDLLEVERLVPPPASRLRVHLRTAAEAPPQAGELAKRIAARLGPGASDASVELVVDPGRADYALVVQQTEHGTGTAAWTRGGRAPDALPARAAAVSLAEVDRAAERLASQARRLARVRAWLALESAPGEDGFPYRLAVERPGGGDPLAHRAVVRAGESHGLALVREEGAGGARWAPHYVYVVSLDAEGAIRVVYPRRGAAVENRLPVLAATEASLRLPQRIGLGRISFGEPYGIETLVLLATRDSLAALDALEQPGADAPGASGELPRTARGTGTRGERAPEAAWIVQQVQVVSGR